MHKKKIELGKQYRNLVPLKCVGSRPVRENGSWAFFYLCKCLSCGKEVEMQAVQLGVNVDCGCTFKNKRIKVEVGQVFGRLTVLSVYEKAEKRRYFCLCKCTCGETVEVKAGDLKTGTTQSCGCRNRENQKDLSKRYFDKVKEKYIIEGTHVSRINDMKIPRNNTSGVRGVSWVKAEKLWRSRITFKGIVYYLGKYKKLEDAARVRKLAEENLFETFLKNLQEQRVEQEKKKDEK